MHAPKFLAVKATLVFTVLCVAALYLHGGCSKQTEAPNQKQVEPAVIEKDSAATGSLPDIRKMEAERRERQNTTELPAIRIEDCVASQVWLSDTGRLVTAEDETKMANGDSAIIKEREKAKDLANKEGRDFNDWYHKNRTDTFETAAGTFKIICCFGRYSIDGAGISNGGMRQDVLITPSGRKYRCFPTLATIEGMVTSNGRTFIVTSREVFEWAPDPDRPNDDRLIIRVDAPNPTWISHVSQGYIQVHHSNASIFGGFLVPQEAENHPWRFVECPIKGTMVHDVTKREDGKLLLTAFEGAGKNIVFDPMNEDFVEAK